MAERYQFNDHIRSVDAAARAENILDQREITIQTYQTSLPYDFDALNTGIENAWLTPAVPFGVFSRGRNVGTDNCAAVLGLQDQLSVRTYDYDVRRPLFFSWSNVIVETVKVRYHRDSEGLLRFTTTGGGRRITPDRLEVFNGRFLNIPKGSVTKRHFDLAKLRDLCFKRFVDRLYMVRFSDPSAKAYQSIDHALFQSRKYIDPNAPRLQEVLADKLVKIEAFDSDIDIHTPDLADVITVRFFINGSSGALRLRFPKFDFEPEVGGVDAQIEAFYRLVDLTYRAIVDDGYYTLDVQTFDELRVDQGMFADMVDLVPFQQAMAQPSERQKFFREVNLDGGWHEWQPHLRALDQLLLADEVAEQVRDLMGELVSDRPLTAARLLSVCQSDARLRQLGPIVAGVVAKQLPGIPSEVRAHVEESLLYWLVECEERGWDVDVEAGEILVQGLRWKPADFAFDLLPTILWKVLSLVHERLLKEGGDVAGLLEKYLWCVEGAKEIPRFHSRCHAALRLICEGKAPRSVSESRHVLKEAVLTVAEMDDAVLAQFGLPLWPVFRVTRRGGDLVVVNAGIGGVGGVRVVSGDGGDSSGAAVDLPSGQSVTVPANGLGTTVSMRFTKYGKEYGANVPVTAEVAGAVAVVAPVGAPAVVSVARAKTQRRYRTRIDPDGKVVGSSPCLQEVFEQIHHANEVGDHRPVLLLGERGVGKSHIADLLHTSSKRGKGLFRRVNAGSGGGDETLQRGEWFGYSKNHGIRDVPREGRMGHLEAVGNGTLFIDEFEFLSMTLQSQFLSALEGQSVQKVGGESFVPKARCIFATNADLQQAVASKKLRPDLLDRILTKITIPPLRERRGDILLLARQFGGDVRIGDRCLLALYRHDWPGNVRELEGTMAKAVVRMRSDAVGVMEPSHLELPSSVVAAVGSLVPDACRGEVWRLVDGVAREEGYAEGKGLQKRVSEIMGVSEGEVSKTYRECGLGNRVAG